MMASEKILIAGGSGLVGTFLSDFLDKKGYEVHIVSRSKNEKSKFKHWVWDLKNGTIDTEGLRVDHIINLTGAAIVDKPWTEDRKKILISSRVESTRLLLKGLQEIKHKPQSFISASAIGIYGDRGTDKLTEKSSDGSPSFMVECCQKWEAAALLLKEQCHNLSIVRIGLVLSTQGGILQKLSIPIKMGQANYFGDGAYYYSWIHIEDLARMIHSCIAKEGYTGILNGVSPEPLPAKEFMRGIKKHIASYALVYPLPRLIIKLIMGSRAVAITNSTRVIPAKALSLGFDFKFKDLALAVADLSKRKI